MLKKCLKYDLNANFRIFVILAVIVLSTSVAGGVGNYLIESTNFNALLGILGFFLFYPAVLTISVFPAVMLIMIGVRCYSNFYTDQGYLTFTLPVSRTTHLHSKLLSSAIYFGGAILTSGVGLTVMMSVFSFLSKTDPYHETIEFLRLLFEDVRYDAGFSIIILIELAFIALLLFVTVILWMHFCVVFGSTIARRVKLLAIILTAYISGIIAVYALYFEVFISIFTFVDVETALIDTFTPTEMSWSVIMALGIVIAALATVSALFYRYAKTKLERSLNLS